MEAKSGKEKWIEISLRREIELFNGSNRETEVAIHMHVDVSWCDMCLIILTYSWRIERASYFFVLLLVVFWLFGFGFV